MKPDEKIKLFKLELIYECRLCGLRFTDQVSASNTTLENALYSEIRTRIKFPSAETHYCVISGRDRVLSQIGISDFIGVRAV